MKVLLLGEFSALHKNLKEGLQRIGHEVVVAASGDGFKKIPADISFDATLPSLLGSLECRLKPLFLVGKMAGFDVVQLINPFIFSRCMFPALYLYEKIVKHNNRFFILGAGDDAYFWRYARKAMRYSPHDDFLKYDYKNQNFYMDSDRALRFNEQVVDLSRGVIPIMYEYEVGYESHKKRLPTIPIPINTDEIKFQENIAKKKLVVFHGLNRYGFKGTRHVESAFEYLSKKYPKDLELIINKQMPLSQYLDVMTRTNIVIDQVNSYSLGVNGVYALAMGKVVMGGAEPESLSSLGVTSSPVINVIPNATSLIEEIEKLLDEKKELERLGLQSRIFAENVHGYKKVAQQYIDVWSAH